MPRRRQLSRRDVVMVLAVLIVLSTALRATAAFFATPSWIVGDEAIYRELGTSLFGSLEYELFGSETGYRGLYPLLVGAAGLAGDVERQIDILRIVQPFIISLTAVPVYLWTRSLAGRGWALGAAATTLCLPALAYSGLLMTETVFVPLATAGLYAAARALIEPTLGRQALALGLAAAAGLTRAQGAILFAVIGLAALLGPALMRDMQTLRRLAPSLAAIAALIPIAVLWSGEESVAGSGSDVWFGTELSLRLRWIAYQAGDVVLSAAVIPLVAVGVLAATALVERVDRNVAAYVAVATAATAAFTIQAALYVAGIDADHLFERYNAGLTPTLVVGLLAWLGRRPSGSLWLATGLSLGTLAILALFPLNRFLTEDSAPWDAFTLVALDEATSAVGIDARLGLMLGAAALVAVALLAATRRPEVVAAIVACVLAGAAVIVSVRVAGLSSDAVRQTNGPRFQWIDDRVEDSVAYLHSGNLGIELFWRSAFWNEAVRVTLALDDARFPPPVVADRVVVGSDGAMMREDSSFPRYLVTSANVRLQAPLVGSAGGLSLWASGATPRVRELVTGVNESGRAVEPVRLEGYACQRSTVVLHLRSDELASVSVGVPGSEQVRTTVHPGRTRTIRRVLEPTRPRCTVTVDAPPSVTVIRLRTVRLR